MKKEENYQAELDISREMIRDYSATLAEHGFEYKETHISHSDLTGDSIQFTFVTKKTGISMKINYNPSLNNMRRLFAAIIEKNGEKQRLYLDQYLKIHKRNDLLAFFMDRGRVLEMRAFWNGFFGVLESLFSNELKEVIEGRRWEGTPFDWDGYK